MADDVRVKLSAEGVAELKQAFREISESAKKEGKEAKEGFEPLKEMAGELGKSFIGFLALEKVVDAMKDLFKETLEGAESLEKLSHQTGLTTDTLQGLQQIAKETGTSTEALNQGLLKLTTIIGQAEDGSKKAAAGFDLIGVRVKDLKQLSPDEQFKLIAEKISAIENPAKRSAAEVALFGKAGQELDSVLRETAEKGLSPFIQRMQQLGIFLDKDSVEATLHAKDSFEALGQEIKGIGTQFLIGLIPDMQKGVEEIMKATTGASNGMKDIGHALGDVFKFILALIIGIGKGIGDTLGQIVFDTMNTFGAISTAWDRLMHRDFKGAASSMVDAYKNAGSLVADTVLAIPKLVANSISETKDELNEMFTDTPEAKKPEGEHGGGHEAAAFNQQQADAIYNLKKARLDNELKLYEAHAALLSDQQRAQYEQGLTALKEYFKQREDAINADYDKQIATLQQKQALLKAKPVGLNDEAGASKKQQELEAIQNEIAIKEQEHQRAINANTEQLRQASKKLNDEQLAAQQKLLEIEGKKADAARLGLQLEAEKLDLELRQAGIPDKQRQQTVDNFKQQGGAKIDFNDQVGEASAAMKSLDTGIKDIQDRVKSGQEFSLQAQQDIINLEKQRLPLLEEQARKLKEIADRTGDAEDKAKAEAYAEKVKEIKTSTDEWGQSMAELRKVGEDTLVNGLTKSITDIANGTKTVGAAFKQLGFEIAQAIEQAIIKMLVLKALQSAGLPGFSSGGPAQGHATGGLIRGPGTSTSDSIPAMLSDGEFVVQAKVAQKPGMVDFLSAINEGKLRSGVAGPSMAHFASGGLVGASATPGGMPNIQIVNVPHPDLIGDYLATAAGHQSVLNIIERNPTRVRTAVGG